VFTNKEMKGFVHDFIALRGKTIQREVQEYDPEREVFVNDMDEAA
jgi:hypothetical protein